MISRIHAKHLRELIENAATAFTDEVALTGIELFPMWQVDHSYSVDERIQYEGKLYRVVQAHTSQVDWTPDVATSLFTEVAKPGEIPVWKQPTGSHDTYQIGDKVWYPDVNTTIYICTINNNSWAPDVYGWEIFS